MKRLAILLFLLVIAVIVKGCGDYYVNVDKEAVKLEIDSLIDKEAIDGFRESD